MIALLLLTVAAPHPHIAMNVVGRGTVVMELYPEQAPKLCEHVLELVRDKFYDGMLIHRKVPDFVIQTGDPHSKKVTVKWARKNPGEYGGTKTLGDGGSGKSVKYEINDLVHEKFAVGMALESPMDDSGDSQFFINLKDNFRLNGMYEVFAKVTSGQDVVMKIERGDKIKSIKRID